jgi:hypothetical protein
LEICIFVFQFPGRDDNHVNIITYFLCLLLPCAMAGFSSFPFSSHLLQDHTICLQISSFCLTRSHHWKLNDWEWSSGSLFQCTILAYA